MASPVEARSAFEIGQFRDKSGETNRMLDKTHTEETSAKMRKKVYV